MRSLGYPVLPAQDESDGTRKASNTEPVYFPSVQRIISFLVHPGALYPNIGFFSFCGEPQQQARRQPFQQSP